jgi:GNAT superfamily N-acetyltransferase
VIAKAGGSVREGTPEDVGALAELRWQAEERDLTGIDRDEFLQHFTRWAGAHLDSHLPFVAEVDGVLVGMAWLALTSRVPHPGLLDRRTGDIQSVYVVPELRNRGVGGALIAAVLREAGRRGLERVTVHSGDRPLPFYRRHGFIDDHHWLQRGP